MNVGNGNVIHPLRLATSGVSGGPGIFEILGIIGKEKTIIRINTILEKAKRAPRGVCWKGYKMVGMKKKNGKKVPNCVPSK